MNFKELKEEIKNDPYEPVLRETIYLTKPLLLKVLGELQIKSMMVDAGMEEGNACDSLLLYILMKNFRPEEISELTSEKS